MINNSCGKKLRDLRKSKGKTLQEVADATGLKVSALTMYELGQRIPRDAVKVTLAQYYGHSVGSIFFDEDATQSGTKRPRRVAGGRV